MGTRPILLLGVLGLGVMFFVPSFSDSLTVILLSRVLGGMFSANIAVAQAYIADVTPKEQRAAAFGKIGACFGVGFILGPAAGGLIGEYSIRLPFILAGTLAILNFFYGLFILPESLRIKNPKRRHVLQDAIRSRLCSNSENSNKSARSLLSSHSAASCSPCSTQPGRSLRPSDSTGLLWISDCLWLQSAQ